ncbi:ParB/RepB/Spo0J family partition protein [Candidatus Pelagibacter sp. RS40]|uniref:ParB/RepB/Spo0J family partition protein n=1 Tax=Candidatus Pelagibacter sp. RS40 TaxID=1977865 RepID=UPI0026BBD761|nr:ParB/RepB/Spo0J family partition protein [Candidatus Pelagibacter sp. RS40]
MINPFKNKKGLGRGLSSLIGDSEVKITNNKISISSIIPNKYQPRKKFDKNSLEELTASIRERGIIQPIIVRASEDSNDKYELIAGERRWQAAQNAGLHEVPVVILNVDNLKSLEFAIVENVQRKDLNPIEEAEGYQRLINEFNYDQEKVAKFIGKSRAHISNCIRLLSLPTKVIEHIINEKISQGHAKVLVGLDNSELLAEKIIKKKLSVRQAEALARLVKSNKSSIKSKDPNSIDIENQLSSKIGMKVFLNNKKNNTGTLIFEYKGVDQLDRLIKIIKENY